MVQIAFEAVDFGFGVDEADVAVGADQIEGAFEEAGVRASASKANVESESVVSRKRFQLSLAGSKR